MHLYVRLSLLVVMISGSLTVYAVGAIAPFSGSAGYQLVEDVGRVIREESSELHKRGERGISVGSFPALRRGTQTRDILESDLNRHFSFWFDYVALVPTPQMVDRVVDEIYFILMRSTGSSILQSRSTESQIRSRIRALVAPRQTRASASCVSMLFQRAGDSAPTIH